MKEAPGHIGSACETDGRGGALTINRSMGQTLDRALLDLRRPPFSHGHGYVAISRVHTADELGAFVDDACSPSCGRTGGCGG